MNGVYLPLMRGFSSPPSGLAHFAKAPCCQQTLTFAGTSCRGVAQPGCRIKLHFIPSYCPHLNPIERLWGLMHRNVTHNKCYATCAQFADATLKFLRETVPRNWADLCDSVTDNFRIINPKDFRVVA